MNILQFFFNFKSNDPVYDLRKKESKSFTVELNNWVERNFYSIVFLILVIVVSSFLLFCLMCGFSATESGAMRNFIARGV